MAITKALRSQGQSVVFFERSFKSPHLQIQCVAIPSAKENLAREIFLEMASMQSITLDELPDHAELRQVVRPGSPYFLLELPQKQRFVCNIRGRFPLQFGREVLAHQELLNCPERIDWKNCPSSRDLEIKETTRFRKLFQPFDFTVWFSLHEMRIHKAFSFSFSSFKKPSNIWILSSVDEATFLIRWFWSCGSKCWIVSIRTVQHQIKISWSVSDD